MNEPAALDNSRRVLHCPRLEAKYGGSFVIQSYQEFIHEPELLPESMLLLDRRHAAVAKIFGFEVEFVAKYQSPSLGKAKIQGA